ncbi:ATP-dependent Clp protease proteolytic subunit [Curtobacterium sp. KT1]
MHCGRSVDRLRADTDHDRVFTARQAWQWGLVDHVITRR